MVDFFGKVGPTLEFLTITSYSCDENSVGFVMEGVRKCTFIKSLTVLGRFSMSFGEFWSSVGGNIGKNIVKLRISVKDIPEEEWPKILDEIIKFCPFLEDVELTPPATQEHHYVRFLRNLGKQLAFASFDGISSELFPRIEEECPYLRGKLSVMSSYNLKGLENILGELFMDLGGFDDLVAISKDLAPFKYLEKLEIHHPFGSPIGTFTFYEPMRYLKLMDLDGCIKARELISVLKFTPHLSSLEVDFIDIIEDGNIFDEFAFFVP